MYYEFNGSGISKKDICNPHTLNIFTDASIRKRGYGYDGCYGAIAVDDDHIIDQIYRISSETTNNNAEIKGLRAGVFLALKYKNQFKIINIFSDSEISIRGIRDRIVNWKINDSGILVGKTGPIANQDIYLEIVYLMLRHNLRVNFLHQKGHVTNHINSLYNAQHVFSASNMIRGRVDLNLIRYISNWNNIVDKTSRSILLRCRTNETKFLDVIQFYPSQFNRKEYRALSENTIKKGSLT